MRKRIISLLIAMFLALSLLPTTVLADGAEEVLPEEQTETME